MQEFMLMLINQLISQSVKLCNLISDQNHSQFQQMAAHTEPAASAGGFFLLKEQAVFLFFHHT